MTSSLTTTNTTTIQCFTTTVELRDAVQQYVQPGIASNPNSDLAIRYGYPINNWCVSKITDFSYLFTPPDSTDVTTLFNDNIASWDMSNAINISSMFEGAFAFNQDISNWDVTNIVAMDRIFYRAFSFNISLCPWGTKLQSNKGLTAMDAFTNTGCPIQDDPSFTATSIPGPFCYPCSDSSSSGSNAPAATPTTNSNNSNNNNSTQTNICFQDRVELELALSEYLVDNSPTSSVSAQYGWPINTWCVSNVTDLAQLFSPVNNLDKVTFNEDISKWDVSNAITVERMFDGNEFFNQDLSTWQFGPNLQNAYRMFFGAKSFNQSLCAWGLRSTSSSVPNPFTQSTMNVTQMFRDTACPNLLDPSYDGSVLSPFCYDCNGNTTTTTATSAPVAPVVPVLTNPPTTPKTNNSNNTNNGSAPTQSPTVNKDTPPEPGSTPPPAIASTTAPTPAPASTPTSDGLSSLQNLNNFYCNLFIALASIILSIRISSIME